MHLNYDDLIAHENEHSGLDFKAVQYTADQHEALLKDVMAMANASVRGERLIVIGVKHRADGSREYLPIPKAQFVDAAIYQQLVRENIEPELEVEYFPYAFRQSLLGILRIARADDPPYMLRKDFGKLRRGECLVRKGTHQHRACRDDLNRYFKGTSREHFDRSLSLGFLDQNYAGTLDYQIRKFDWPSDLARQRIEAALASKRARAAHLGRTLSSLDLTLAGKPLPFEHRSIEALEQNLKTVNEDFEGSDYHTAFMNALELNLELLNDADEYLIDASLELTIPRQEGLFVFDRFCHPPDAEGWVRALPTDYPEVNNRAGEYCIRAPLGDLKHKIHTVVFDEALRIDVGEELAGCQITIRCSLFAKNLPMPIERTLVINVREAQASQ